MMRYITFIVLIIAFGLLAACGGRVAERNNAGNRHYQREDYNIALRTYQQAQVLNPDRPEAYYNAAAALVGANDYTRAIAALEQAIAAGDDGITADAYYNLGNTFYAMTRYDAAIEAYQQTLLLNPDDAEARHNLEVALLRYVPPSPTAQEQQTEPDMDQTDPDVTPTDQPGGFDGPTPTPPPQDFDLTATPDSGEGAGGGEDSSTPVPQSQGDMTVEEAERLLEQIQQDQEALSEYLEDEASSGEIPDRDW